MEPGEAREGPSFAFFFFAHDLPLQRLIGPEAEDSEEDAAAVTARAEAAAEIAKEDADAVRAEDADAAAPSAADPRRTTTSPRGCP